MDDAERNLRDAVYNMDITALQDAFGKLPDPPAERKAAVDACFKMKSIALLKDTKDFYTAVSRLLDFGCEAASKEYASKTIPVVVLTEIFEATTIDKCEKLFAYVEEKTPQWKSAGILEPCRTQLLRMCNDLLRRLSRTIDTEFCGRIFIFLARCLPLTEKSGLNLISQFNVDNITKFDPVENDVGPGAVVSSVSASVDEQSQAQKATPNESMEVEEGETDVAGSSNITVDYNLYVKFWQLQSFFASPNTCYEKVGWRQLQRNANDILNAFQLLKLEPPSSSSTASSSSSAKKMKLDEDERSGHIERRRPTWADKMAFTSFSEEQQRSTYFAKYLTSQRLLHLQFNDSTFRRYILVQFVIVFQYLTADVKFKDKKTHVLNDEQSRWIDESVKKCYDLLAETYPHGEQFVKVVQRILNREEHWNQWKNAGCDDFTQKADKEKMLMFKKRQKPRMEDKKFDLGNPTLTQLWNVCPDNFEACKSIDRKFVPELEPFLDEALEQLDPDAGIEDKYKLVNDENFQWRSLRLLAMKSPQFFTPMTATQSISGMLSSMLEKIAEDIPKFKDLKAKREKKDGSGSDKAANGQDMNHQQEQEIVRTDANAEEEAEFRAQNLEGPGEQTVTPEQIESLSTLIGADWTKLAQEIEMADDSIAALKKKQVPSHACSVVLRQWCDSEGSMALVKRLRNILLKAELFNEDVSAVLSTAAGVSSSGHGSQATSSSRPVPILGNRTVAPLQPDRDEPEETEAKPARLSSSNSTSRKRSSNAQDGNRAPTPVMDERQSTASNS